ncbi:MAG: hypothetical protein JSU72_07385 [Deltaproteobacteria bacterium]|nr:MAG: hypothetical protein JSU72_07385 [Deltaproteobacteria bacterium]
MRAARQQSRIARFGTSRYWRYFLWVAVGSHILWLVFDFLWPYYWTLLACLLGPLAICRFTQGAKDEAVNWLCACAREDMSRQDRLTGEVDRIRCFKAQRNFDKALTLVNNVLDQDPDFAEALYLKAQVMWEGFKNPWAAETYFRRVIEITEDKEPVHRWASSCLAGIHNKFAIGGRALGDV